MLHRGRIRVKMSGIWSSENGTEIVTGANLIVLIEVAILSGREETIIETGIGGERLSQNPTRFIYFFIACVMSLSRGCERQMSHLRQVLKHWPSCIIAFLFPYW